jgi:hypothetical protein
MTERPARDPASRGNREFAAFLDGYLHQDFVSEHGTAEAAAREYARVATTSERRAALAGLEAFIAIAETETRQEWLRRLHLIGGAWRPRSLAALRSVARSLAERDRT